MSREIDRPLANSPDALASFASECLTHATSVLLVHRRGRRFRVSSLFEIPLFGCCFLALLPVVLVLSEGDADGEAGLPKFRLFNYHHRVDIAGLDAGGQVIARGNFVAPDQATMDRALSTLLSWARAQQRVVFEELEAGEGAASRESMSAWFGGSPLFETPRAIDEARAIAELEFAGLSVTRTADALQVGVSAPPRSRALAWLVLLLFAVPLSIFARQSLRRVWLDARGVAPETHKIDVRAEGVRMRETRGDVVLHEDLLTGNELLGFAFSDSLGFDKDVTRRGPALRIVGHQRTRWMRLSKVESFGAALRDVLLASTLRLRALRPELGLPFGYDQPTHCPFCSALFVCAPGTNCPSCGAPAGSGRHH